MAWYTRREARDRAETKADPDALLSAYYARLRRLSDEYLRLMGEHIADIGKLWPSDVHRLQQIRRMNRNLRQIERQIGAAAGLGADEIEDVFRQIAREDVRMETKILGAPDTTRIEDNVPLQRILRAQARETADSMANMSNTTVVSGFYRKAVDEAVSAVQSGVEDYGSAIRRVIREAGAAGLRVLPNGTKVVDYESGFSRRLDTAARMNVLDGARHLNQDIMEEVGRQFGADGVEIDAHMLCAEDHLPYQGEQYTQQDFESIQDGLDRPFGEWNCRHSWHPIIMGISPRMYSPEELDQMRRYSTEEIEIDGRTKTRYQWSQEMRRVETAIRAQKDTATLARHTGDDALRRKCQGTVVTLNEYYAKVANAAGLKPEYQRTYVSGFQDMKPDDSSLMSKGQSSDTINAAPIPHMAEEYAELVRYAEERGIQVYDIKSFDGDISMFKEQVDAIAEVRAEYGLNGRLTIRFDTLKKSDLAETNTPGDVITFSNLYLRDRQATNRYLNADNTLATNDSKGIAYHEMGHVLSKVYGNRGLDIAREAYYNLKSKDISRSDLFEFLENSVSEYSTFIKPEWIEKPFQRRYFKEIIPEILSKDKTNPTDFTKEFIRLLKGRCGV